VLVLHLHHVPLSCGRGGRKLLRRSMLELEPGGRRGRVQSATQLDCGQGGRLEGAEICWGSDLPAPVMLEDVTAG
jgi:hypothetical protein